VFQLTADNSDDPGWNTLEKVKRNVKMIMKFFDERFIVGDKVYFELRSFAFDQMEHNEANRIFDEAKMICAQKLGVDPEILETQAKALPF